MSFAPSWLIALLIAGIVAMFGPAKNGPHEDARIPYQKFKTFLFVFAAAWIVLYFAAPAVSTASTTSTMVGGRDPVLDNIDIGDPTF